MTEAQIDRAAWTISMAIGVPIIMAAHWFGIFPKGG